MSGQTGSVDPKGISMCTNCRHMVQTREMRMGFSKLLCPACYAKFKTGKQLAQDQEEKIESDLDPAMKKLKDKLEKKGLI